MEPIIDMTELTRLFKEKLDVTGSMDAAFKKAVWVAYQSGVEAGRQSAKDEEVARRLLGE
jgi:hypothetical protein